MAAGSALSSRTASSILEVRKISGPLPLAGAPNWIATRLCLSSPAVTPTFSRVYTKNSLSSSLGLETCGCPRMVAGLSGRYKASMTAGPTVCRSGTNNIMKEMTRPNDQRAEVHFWQPYIYLRCSNAHSPTCPINHNDNIFISKIPHCRRCPVYETYISTCEDWEAISLVLEREAYL